MAGMRRYIGTSASPGIAIGPAFLYLEPDLEVVQVDGEGAAAEFACLRRALDSAQTHLGQMESKAARELGTEEAAIFEAHALILQDPALLEAVEALLEEEGINVEAAWDRSVERFAKKLEAVDDEYFQARAVDVRDVGQLVLRMLLGVEEADLSSLEVPSVVVAEDLTPSATARLERDLVLAFCTAEGGPTSHTAILAKALGIPAVVAVGPELLGVEPGTEIVVDGVNGQVFVGPDSDTRHRLLKRREDFASRTRAEKEQAQDDAITPDGRQVEVVANVGNLADVAAALEHGAEGIGLLRTEFLYLNRRSAPDEEEQMAVYSAILEQMGGRPVVVRTLDVGGDKELPYIEVAQEQNPFLGLRAIRISLAQPDYFRVQLRALLRVSPGHDLRIMFPMVSTIEEVRAAKSLLSEVREEVRGSGHAISEAIQVGIMVEVPSVALLADHFAAEVDFFSIGTNDLTQYTMAAERTNARVAHLNDPCHPAVLRQIRYVVEAAQQAGRWVGVCGEAAGDVVIVPILLGLGVDELSMAPASIPGVKALIRKWPILAARRIAEEALSMESASDVRRLANAHPITIGLS